MDEPSGEEDEMLDPGESTGNWGATCWCVGA